MLSVLRITVADEARRDELLNRLRVGGADVALRHRRDGLVVTLETSPLWADHLKAASGFLDTHRVELEAATALGAQLTLDVAIDPEDQASQRHALLLRVSAPLLATLGALKIDLEFSIYRPALASDPP